MRSGQGLLSMLAVVAVALALMPLGAAPAGAQSQPDPAKKALELEAPSPERGLSFAQRFCKDCHLVDDSGSTTVQAGLPSLRGIANKPEQSGERIRNVLINPHPPMPDMQESQQEILDVISYLETLRTDKSAPPFLAPAQPGTKPLYPKPS